MVGVPVYLQSQQGWSFWQVGAFLAVWVIGYGAVQASAPGLFRRRSGGEPTGRTATTLAFALAAFPALIAVALSSSLDPSAVIVVGLILFGAMFALNSAVHSFLILHYAEGDKVAMNVGFYYMANACGRLAGTVLSGALYQWQGLDACLWTSASLLLAAGTVSLLLPHEVRRPPTPRPLGAVCRRPPGPIRPDLAVGERFGHDSGTRGGTLLDGRSRIRTCVGRANRFTADLL